MKSAVGGSHRRLKQLAFVVLVIALAGGRDIWADDDDSENGSAKFSAEAAATFNKRCTACHTYGKGVKVGPDLKGVNERRKRDWIVKFVRGSSAVIKSGDPIATGLFAQFKQQRMPDWTDLSEKQVSDIIDFIAVGGPDIKPADERSAELAAPAEIENGRRLFTGETRLKYGARACSTCHSVQGAGWGGSLGPELTKTYLRYQDRALTEFLRHPCFQWNTGASGAAGTHYLTAKESFAIKAFLRHAALQQSAQAGNAGRNPTSAHPAAEAVVRTPEKGNGQ